MESHVNYKDQFTEKLFKSWLAVVFFRKVQKMLQFPNIRPTAKTGCSEASNPKAGLSQYTVVTFNSSKQNVIQLQE